MAEADSTVGTIGNKNLLAAGNALSGATAIAHFVQGVTLRSPRGEDLTLCGEEVTGLYYVIQDLIDKIKLAVDSLGSNAGAFALKTSGSQEIGGAK